jgi:hypothetical protein
MISSQISLIATVSRRIFNDWLIVGSAFVTILLAMVLLASGAIYADSPTISALRRSLGEAPASEANISIQILLTPPLQAPNPLTLELEPSANRFSQPTQADP